MERTAARKKPPFQKQQFYFLLFAGFAGASLGTSPKILVIGHTLKAGHFLHPATTAIGQRVILIFQV
jgi:hypothetical protein